MKIEIRHRDILIIPENKLDEFYIEEALGLKKAEDWAKAVRVDGHGVSSCAYIRVEKRSEGEAR